MATVQRCIWPDGLQTELVLSNLCTRRKKMKKLFERFAKDESGATAIEYGLIAAGISVAIVTVVGSIGDSLSSTFGEVDSGLE